SLDYIPDEVDRLDRILTRYLTFGKGGNGFDMERLDLSRLAYRSVRMAEQEMAAAGIDLAVEAPEAPLYVTGDNPSLQQVMLNLLLNARDAMPGGGRIAVVMERSGREAVLRVLDEGTGLGGMSEREIFEPFLTTKEKGSGLGLTVVRQVVEDHGGTFSLSDRNDGPGAVAEMRLPVCDGR
ncbi:HAMP domain-containing histidine kinase, partial [bacterium]|nr:HAMP domain-containing histidine kinase [bacterium]